MFARNDAVAIGWLAVQDDVERTSTADGTIRLTHAGTIVRLRKLRPGVLYLAVHGPETEHLRVHPMRELEREIMNGPIALFADMRKSPRVDAVGRNAWGEFGRKHKPHIRRVLMLVSSRLVEMALSLIGLIMGGGVLKTVSNERAFVAELAREVPGLTQLPLSVAEPAVVYDRLR